MKQVYLLIMAFVPEETQPADVRDVALEALNVPTPDTLHWTWDAAISER